MTKILVIEDDALLREEVVDWLSFEGYEVASAKDGVAGVESALQDRPDLIVCDITMPRLDGYGVLFEIRAHPATASIPFIFLTARAAYEDIRRGMSLGADDYIIKPFTNEDFMQAVQIRLAKKVAQERDHQFEVDQLQQALEVEHEQRMLKAKLVAMFSHDFRNPLTNILTATSLVRDFSNRMDEKRRLRHLNQIEGSVHQLLQMLDDMLMLAQMETGNFNFKPQPVDVEPLFQSIVEEFQTIYSETDQISFESRFSETLMADPRLLRQIAANLISNAIKYSPQGGDVRVALDELEGQCVLTVQDYGVGIPEVDQARLFAAFQRGSNVADVSGTGLGLAIVKQAVDLHGGSVHFESQVGGGTTMIVMIPIHPE